jgi:nitroreductase/NAD-dependent dihydropyrimidine dehydrogenase PreA subunit
MQSEITITETCRGCGACADVCAMQILAVTDAAGTKRAAAVPERTGACMRCGHCMAVCPTASIHVEGLEYGRDLVDLPEHDVDGPRLDRFLATRRSVRTFRDRPVPRELLAAIVEAIGRAPMGYPPAKVGVTVAPERRLIEEALPVIRAQYESLAAKLHNPIARFFIRRSLGPDAWTALSEHVMPGFRWRLPEMKAGGRDTITRGAPAMLLFHAPPAAGSVSEDVFIAATYAALAAHALGLGACILGLVAPIVQRAPALRALFAIPDGDTVMTAVVVGFPRLKFQRAIRRPLPRVTWL